MIATVLLHTLAFATPAAALWPWLRSSTTLSAIHRMAAAFGLGLALSSTFFFLWRVTGGQSRPYVALEALLWVVVAYLGTRRRPMSITEEHPRPATALLPGAIVVVLVALAAVLLYDWIRANPYGRWDAWAIWNLKARFLATDSGGWRNLFDVVEAHPDYPLLLSGAVARSWVLLGATPASTPMAISLLFFLSTVATVVGSLHATRGTTAAVVGLALVTVPTFVLLGGAQMADVPLAFFTVLALTLLAGSDPSPRQIVLGAAAAGFAGWTKNEGLVVAIALPALYLLIRLRRDGLPAVRRIVPYVAAGLLPLLLLVAAFKLLLAPDSPFVTGLLNPRAFHHWSEPQRVTFVARHMIRESLTWGGWPIGGPVWLLGLLIAIPRRLLVPADPAVAAAGLLLLVQCLVFFCTYVMTPEPLAWHLQTSWFRLIAQLWPTAIWWACSTKWPRRNSRL